MAISVDKISPAFDLTKRFLFPIKAKIWMKLGFVSLLSASQRFGGGSGIRGNLNSIGDLPGNSIAKIIDFVKTNIFLIGAGIGLITIINILFNIIQHIFSFILIDSVLTNKVEIGSSFHKHKRKGISTFLFWLVLGILNLLFLVLLALPLLIPILKNLNNLSFSLISIPYLIFFILMIIIDIFVFVIISFIFYNFVVIDMYQKNILSIKSFGRMFNLVKKELKEVFIYFLMKIALGIGAGIISIIVLIPFLIILGIVVLIAVLLGFAIASASTSALIAYIIIAVVFGIVFLLLWIYAMSVVTVPIPVFFINYAYLFLAELNKRNKQLFMQ